MNTKTIVTIGLLLWGAMAVQARTTTVAISTAAKTDTTATNGDAEFVKGADAYLARDYAEAIKWYKKAAEKENPYALYQLGLMYAVGEGVAPDGNEAVKWLKKAADKGNVDAMYELGEMYSNGDGVTVNTREARRWYRKAAKEGDGRAQEALKRNRRN